MLLQSLGTRLFKVTDVAEIEPCDGSVVHSFKETFVNVRLLIVAFTVVKPGNQSGSLTAAERKSENGPQRTGFNQF